MRPEPFGALLYHFGTRKLSFLKNRVILSVLQSLPDHPDAHTALDAAGIGDVDRAPYLDALAVLAASNMLVRTDLRHADLPHEDILSDKDIEETR